MPRTCTECGKSMEVLKTGFTFMTKDYKLRNSDLWGCIACSKLQIHGMPKNSVSLNIVDSPIMSIDPGNKDFWAILYPEIKFCEDFYLHMDRWSPHWNIRKMPSK